MEAAPSPFPLVGKISPFLKKNPKIGGTELVLVWSRDRHSSFFFFFVVSLRKIVTNGCHVLFVFTSCPPGEKREGIFGRFGRDFTASKNRKRCWSRELALGQGWKQPRVPSSVTSAVLTPQRRGGHPPFLHPKPSPAQIQLGKSPSCGGWGVTAPPPVPPALQHGGHGDSPHLCWGSAPPNRADLG